MLPPSGHICASHQRQGLSENRDAHPQVIKEITSTVYHAQLSATAAPSTKSPSDLVTCIKCGILMQAACTYAFQTSRLAVPCRTTCMRHMLSSSLLVRCKTGPPGQSPSASQNYCGTLHATAEDELAGPCRGIRWSKCGFTCSSPSFPCRSLAIVAGSPGRSPFYESNDAVRLLQCSRALPW